MSQVLNVLATKVTAFSFIISFTEQATASEYNVYKDTIFHVKLNNMNSYVDGTKRYGTISAINPDTAYSFTVKSVIGGVEGTASVAMTVNTPTANQDVSSTDLGGGKTGLDVNATVTASAETKGEYNLVLPTYNDGDSTNIQTDNRGQILINGAVTADTEIVYNIIPPTLVDGQRSDMQSDVNGKMLVVEKSAGTIKTNTDPLVTGAGGGYVRQDSTGTIAKETGGNLATVKTNTDTLVTAAGGGYVRQDSTGTIAKESGGNLADIHTHMTDGNQIAQAVGNVAHSVADTGAPVKIGGVYRSAGIPADLVDGDRADLQVDVNAYLKTTRPTMSAAGNLVLLPAPVLSLALSIPGQTSAAFIVTGTWTGTLIAEATVDGMNWVQVPTFDYSTKVQSTANITANGTYGIMGLYGISSIRVRATALTVAPATIVIMGSSVNSNMAQYANPDGTVLPARIAAIGGNNGGNIKALASDASGNLGVKSVTGSVVQLTDGTDVNQITASGQVLTSPGRLSGEDIADDSIAVNANKITPTIYVKNLAVIATEYSQALPAFCKGFTVKLRETAGVCKIAWNAGDLAAGTYFTIPANSSYSEESCSMVSKTIYMTSDTTNVYAEIIAWS